jgi:hypothetical protein
MNKKYTPLSDLGYSVYKTTKGYAVAQCADAAEEVDEMWQHSTYQDAEDALHMSFAD